MNTRIVYSPLFIFLLALVAAEFFIRLPFVLFTLNSMNSSPLEKLHFFSIYRPTDVIMLGLGVLTFALILILATSLITPARIKVKNRVIPRVPKTIYFVCIFVCGASLVAIAMVGVENLLLSFSSKRSDLSDRGILWILLKIAQFNHVLIMILYLRYLKYGHKMDQLFIVVSFFVLAAVSIVFSQRAVLMSLILGIFYIALLYGRLRIRTVVYVIFFVGVVVLGVSALRPGVEYSSNLEAVQEGLRRAVMSRYFFDFSKLGTVLHWNNEQNWMGPIVIGFLLKPFFGDLVIFYKEVGPILAAEVYLYRSETGVTPGLMLESVLSFGYILGLLFFAAIIQLFRYVELTLFRTQTGALSAVIFPVLVLSKFTLVMNSSLGAYMFQITLEMVLLFFTLSFLNVMRSSKS